MRGSPTPMSPTDPLIYRLYELILVNGPALKVLIKEEFGDGIMSAIDFDMDIVRQSDPKGDRVWLGMTGKFLPFEYYGAKSNELAYGLKEERGWARAYTGLDKLDPSLKEQRFPLTGNLRFSKPKVALILFAQPGLYGRL